MKWQKEAERGLLSKSSVPEKREELWKTCSRVSRDNTKLNVLYFILTTLQDEYSWSSRYILSYIKMNGRSDVVQFFLGQVVHLCTDLPEDRCKILLLFVFYFEKETADHWLC